VGDFKKADGTDHAFLRTARGAFISFDAPGATAGTDATGINAAGEIVGYFVAPGLKAHGYLRTSGSAFTTIDPPSAKEARAYQINAAGKIVGEFRDVGGKQRGYIAGPTQ